LIIVRNLVVFFSYYVRACRKSEKILWEAGALHHLDMGRVLSTEICFSSACVTSPNSVILSQTPRA